MKIKSIEIGTDLGNRHFQLAAPFDIDLTGEMPSQFISFAGMLWDVMQKIAVQMPELAATAPKAEA